MMMGQNGPGPNGLAGRGQILMQQSALERVNRAVLLGGLAALLAALVVGFFIFRAITARSINSLARPINWRRAI